MSTRIGLALDGDLDQGLLSLHEHEACGYRDLTIQLYALAWRRGSAEADPSRASRYLEVLTAGAYNQDPVVAAAALRFSLSFTADALSERGRAELVAREVDDYNGVAVLRVVGHFELQERRPELETLAGPPSLRHAARTEGWTALLALAKMDDENALRRVLATVRDEEDIVTRATILFEDLAFTRQAGAFDLLRHYLHSTQRLPRLKETGLGSPEAVHAAEQLAAHVVGCPVDPDAIREGDLPTVRAWADTQTTWRPR